MKAKKRGISNVLKPFWKLTGSHFSSEITTNSQWRTFPQSPLNRLFFCCSTSQNKKGKHTHTHNTWDNTKCQLLVTRTYNNNNANITPALNQLVQTSCFWDYSSMVTKVEPFTASQQCEYLIPQLARFMSMELQFHPTSDTDHLLPHILTKPVEWKGWGWDIHQRTKSKVRWFDMEQQIRRTVWSC